ncbi:MAG: hypothetical protein IKZ67_03330 [Paludibacteraceae bacterium]|nr:hypothetical protein [Paludibacteraceae bacterium]
MRKLFLGLVLAFSMVACTVPADYFEKVSSEVTSVVQAYNLFAETLSSPIDPVNMVEIAYADAHSAANTSLKTLQGMSECSGNDALRQSAVDFVSTYVSFYDNDFPPVMDAIMTGGNDEDVEAQVKSLTSDFALRSAEKEKVFLDNMKAFMKEFDLYQSGF